MEKNSVWVLAVLAVMVVGTLGASALGHSSLGGASATPRPVALALPAGGVAAPAVPTPASGFQRTVLVETFTAEWCIYCEEESQAMYTVEHTYNLSVVDISELHVCYSPSACGDNYPSADNTSNDRTSYYGVTGFPTVFFDGGNSVVGAVSPTTAGLEAVYAGDILNASMVPGTVSIAQVASMTTGGVTVQANITSDVTGTYHALSYLLEYIGKNDSTGHDLGYVVRESIVNQNVNLVAGNTLHLDATGLVGAGWNTQRFSVVTFIQQNSTKVVQNTNLVPVTTLRTQISTSASILSAATNATITVQATNTTTGAAVPGATVDLLVSGGGSVTPNSGVTDTSGVFTATYTAPSLSTPSSIVITAEVSTPGYVGTPQSVDLATNPVRPAVPAGLSLAPGSNLIYLNWTPVVSYGIGLVYHIYRSTSMAGTYSEIDTTSSTTFVDPGLALGQSYWYRISAEDSIGASANSTAISAAAITVAPVGIPLQIGYWLSLRTIVLTSATNASINLHLPDGSFAYNFGPNSYAYEAPTPSGFLSVSNGVAAVLSLNFTPRYALLQGNVQPVNANVTVDGTTLQVVDGAFSQLFAAGTYTVSVSALGYATNDSTVVLTPGNTTPIEIHLESTSSSSVSPSVGNLAAADVVILAAVIAAIGIATVVGLRMRGRNKGG